jgi:hypothetical protein
MAEVVERCGGAAAQFQPQPAVKRSIHLDVPEEERGDAERTGELVRKKLMEIMDLQADIDALLREKHPTPLGSQKWQNARIETLQRLMLMTAIQFVLFEPVDWVVGNDEFKVAADKMLQIVGDQLKLFMEK